MISGRPSLTAQRVAQSRAAHLLLDAPPPVLNDPVAIAILGEGAERTIRQQRMRFDAPPARHLRAFLVVRSRIAEEALDAAVARGVRQYVVLGAGLDTFAYRNPYAPDALRVFEVDHPATQEWKRTLLGQAGIPLPASLTRVAIDFERDTLAGGLDAAGFDRTAPAFFSWLGVTMYLSAPTITATLAYLAALPHGSAVVFDYAIPPQTLAPLRRAFYRGRLLRVAAAGEPWRSFFTPAQIDAELATLGFTRREDLGPAELNARYFAGRSDGLRTSGPGRIMVAATG
jgi:methyltransferase (TIGR00027 family)